MTDFEDPWWEIDLLVSKDASPGETLEPHEVERLCELLRETRNRYRMVLRDPCRCGCGKQRDEHLCPCGCGHTYEDAVRNVMGGPMYLSWEQAEANIDEHPGVPCKWT